MNLRKIATTLTALGLMFLFAATSAVADDPKPEDNPGYDKTRDLEVEVPEGGELLFDGTQESIDKNWEMWPQTDMAITWSLVDSPTDDTKVLMTNGGQRWGTHDLVTKKKYEDFEAHVEFNMMGARGDDSAEGYCNSGVYLQNRYEIQIESPKGKNVEDPYNWKIDPHGIAAFCMERVPDTNVWRPNGQWQSFHIDFKAARWDAEGNMLEPAHATLWWNGVKVHDNVPIKKVNGGIAVDAALGGLKLQEHGQDVRFRNVWVKETKGE